MILVDTNILVYAINADAPCHEISRALVEAVYSKKVSGVLVPQILLEFFAIVTDPRRISRPLGTQVAWEQVETFMMAFPVLDGGLKALEHLKGLLSEKGIKGSEVFDAFLVAQMKALEISVVCTYNTKDFISYQGILVKTPEEILEGA